MNVVTLVLKAMFVGLSRMFTSVEHMVFPPSQSNWTEIKADRWSTGSCLECGHRVFTEPTFEAQLWSCSNSDCIHSEGEVLFHPDVPDWYSHTPNRTVLQLPASVE